MSRAKLTPEERAARKAAREREKEIRKWAMAEARAFWRREWGRKGLRGKTWAERRVAIRHAETDGEAVGGALVDMAKAAGSLARIMPAKTDAARAFVEAARAFADAAKSYNAERVEVFMAINELSSASMVREIMRNMKRAEA